MGNSQISKLHYEPFSDKEVLYDVVDIKFPLSTKGPAIVDETGRRVKLAGVNWSGSHETRECVGGLDKAHRYDIIKLVRKEFDFNTIRLTFSLEMFFENRVIDEKYLSCNPDLIGKTALQILDVVIQDVTDAGFMVFLNNHTSKSQWCCSIKDGDGLWWNSDFPEQKFFHCLCQLAERYKHNKRVIGIDLRNQVRTTIKCICPVIPTWGTGIKFSDWRHAAEIIGNRIQDIAPHMLIIVGGIDYQKDLTGALKHPVNLKIPNKLVYSGHLYRFSWPFSDPNKISYEDFFKKFFETQLFVRSLGVPYLLGQFGVADYKQQYWKYMLKFLKQTQIDWTIWVLDGYKCSDQQNQSFGLLTKKFNAVRRPDFRSQLIRCCRPMTKNTKKQEVEKESMKEEIRMQESKKEEEEQFQNLEEEEISEII